MKGYVYVIKDAISNDVVYVGSTTQSIQKRFANHIGSRNFDNSPFHVYLRNVNQKPIIEVVCEVEFSVIETLRQKEKEVIKDFATSGIKLLNLIDNIGEKLECIGNKIATPLTSVRISTSVLEQVKKHADKRKQSITGFLDLAALEKIKYDKMNEKILKSSSPQTD